MNVAGAQVGEVAQLGGENLPALTQVVAEEKLNNYITDQLLKAWFKIVVGKQKQTCSLLII